MLPFYKFYNLNENKLVDDVLNDHELFCLWYVHNHELKGDMESCCNQIYEIAKETYYSPLFDDLCDVDWALSGLREKGFIGFKSQSQMVH